MNRQEFLSKLENALEGEVSPRVIQSNLQYYQNYILDEMRKGRGEQEILEELGDPRLIARTIFDSQEAAEGIYGTENYAYDEAAAESHRYAYDEAGGNQRYTYDEESADRYTYDPEGADGEETGSAGNSLWMRIRPTVIIAVVIIVLLAVLSVLFGLALTVLTSPIFWILLAVWGLWNTFGR